MASKELCDKSEELSQLYELSIVESVDLFKAKIPTSTLLFRPHPQQEVKFNYCFRMLFFGGCMSKNNALLCLCTSCQSNVLKKIVATL